MNSLPLKKFIFLLLCFQYICALQQNETPLIQPLSYNTLTQTFDIAALKDLCAKKVACHILFMCADSTSENISSIYETLQQYIHAAPEELKEYITQHVFYNCWNHGYKIAYTKPPTPRTHCQYLVTKSSSGLEVTLNKLGSHQEQILSFPYPIICYDLLDNKLLAVYLKKHRVQLFSNKNGTWQLVKGCETEKPLKDHWHYEFLTLLDHNTCVARSNNVLTIISLHNQKTFTHHFDFTINRMQVINQSHLFIGGYNGHVYRCKKINDQWEIEKINNQNDNFGYFFASADGKACAIKENTETNIYHYDELMHWHLKKPLRLPFNTDNICFFDNPILAFVHYKFKGSRPIRPPINELATFYNITSHQIVGEFKRKLVNKIPLLFDLHPPLTAILAGIVFSKYKYPCCKHHLETLKNSSFMHTIPQPYKDQLLQKIQKKYLFFTSKEL